MSLPSDAGLVPETVASASATAQTPDVPSPLRSPSPAPAAKKSRLHAAAGSTPASASPPELPPLGVIALSRAGFGPRPGALESFEALGATDEARLEAYVEQQLHPESINDSDVEARLVAAGLTTLSKTREQLWQDHHFAAGNDYGLRYQPIYETQRAAFIRAVYSRRQLNEVLADFWHNHFNIYAPNYWIGPLWVHYDRDIIRPNMLGNFRVFLEAVAKSFPMLHYLDLFVNTVVGPNENFARELFELHTLGAENYLGVRDPEEVPVDSEGRPIAYVDSDVYEATRALTGWTVDFELAEFKYSGPDHDRFRKYVLGKALKQDQASLKDGHDVLDLVASHPGTARHISRKLARRLIADNPPARVVEEAAAVFLANAEEPDQLLRVTRAILLSPEFRTTWGQKVKRPFHFAVGILRSLDAQLSFAPGDEPSDYFVWLANQAGHPPFHWLTPDGFPDVAEKWLGTNAIVGGWRTVNWLVNLKNWWSGKYILFDPIAVIPSDVRSPVEIVDFWIHRLLGRPLPEAARLEAIDFMARGRDPEMKLPGFSEDIVRERIHGLLGLILMAPENMMR
ncbi:MAG: DUF1800 domain-containing protein [Limisphaerales bacterium]